jgi:hypothetical protein
MKFAAFSWICASGWAAVISSAALSAGAVPSPARVCEPWRATYLGADATGACVIALWNFAVGAEGKDASGRGRDAKLLGATLAADARFGGCLESFRGHPDEDTRHAAVVGNHPALTPRGAFTLEMWIKPKPELEGYPEAFLADKKYVSDADYQFTLGAADKGGRRRLNMRLGFGDGSESYASEPAAYRAGEWTHLAFTYDGEGGGRFYRDGASLGGADKLGRAGLAPGKHPLSIGDRVGSLYHGFPGFIAQVRLCAGVLEFRPAVLALTSDRDAFVRFEQAGPLRFTLANVQREPLRDATVSFSVDGADSARVRVPVMPPGGSCSLEAPLDTSLRPGAYSLRARVEIPGAAPYVSEESCAVTITPRRPPRMPVVMWGVYGADRVLMELPRLKEIGFTHCLGFAADCGRIFDAGRPVMPDEPEKVAEVKRMLNAALANDFGVIASLSPGHWAAEAKRELRRVDLSGKVSDAKPSLCAAAPGLSNFCYNVGASVAQAYGEFPAWQAALLHTEVRDGGNVCFHEHDRAAYRASAGREYPADAPGKWGAEYAKCKGFPADRVISDDDERLAFLSWYWKAGDGWNALNSALDSGLKSSGRTDLWTFHDPAARVASVYGSGGGVDVISQWTYSYPDPIRIGVATDELFAMARGAAQPQNVMKMTQIIWYRSQTAPAAKGDEIAKAPKSPWEDTDPDAAFPTIAPLHLREAFWTKLARPVRGIMYHGWESLVPVEGSGSSYRYTHPQAQRELARLIREVVEPLGPMLLQVPDRPADVAFLESFASQMYARRGTYGWGNGWSGDAYQMLLWAHLQPEVVYDESVRAGCLERFRVLFMMDCDVLTQGVVTRVKSFQAKGGVVVGDERLCPAIKADVTVQSYARTRKAEADRAALVSKADELRQALDGRYTRYCDASSSDVVPRCRSYGKTDYLFAVNDRREFGDYVGQHGLVMENGLPVESALSLARARGSAYDLVAGREVEAVVRDGKLSLTHAFGPCEGALVMVTDEAISRVEVTALDSAERGAAVACAVAVVDARGRPLDAVVPLRIEVLDPAGAEAEWSGYYGAKDGRLELKLDIAKNDRVGVWRIRARELASRREASAYFRVKAQAE